MLSCCVGSKDERPCSKPALGKQSSILVVILVAGFTVQIDRDGALWVSWTRSECASYFVSMVNDVDWRRFSGA